MKKVGIIIGTIIVAIFIGCFILYKVTFISKSEVKDLVLKDQNLKESEVSRFKIEFSYEDGYFEYEVELIANQREHEFVVDAKTGEIISHETEIR